MFKILFLLPSVLIVILVAACSTGRIMFVEKTKNEAKKIIQYDKRMEGKVVTEEEIKDLPEPVQRYLRYTQIIGKEKIRTVRLRQGGWFRVKREQKWLPVQAEQYFNVDSMEFIWLAKVKFAPLFHIYAKDEFVNGRGNLVVRLLGLFKIVDAEGYEVDQGEILRFLAECIWFPSAFLQDYINWERVDSNSARATITRGGITASAVFHFNQKGEITRITAKRFMEEEGKFILRDWKGQILSYRMFNGIMIPDKVHIIWELDDGDFCYDRIEIVDIEYNETSVY